MRCGAHVEDTTQACHYSVLIANDCRVNEKWQGKLVAGLAKTSSNLIRLDKAILPAHQLVSLTSGLARPSMAIEKLQDASWKKNMFLSLASRQTTGPDRQVEMPSRDNHDRWVTAQNQPTNLAFTASAKTKWHNKAYFLYIHRGQIPNTVHEKL